MHCCVSPGALGRGRLAKRRLTDRVLLANIPCRLQCHGRSATKGEIKAAYRLLALKHHPDVQKGSGDGGQFFRQLTEAYQTLTDDSKRRAYDVTLGIKHVRTHTHNPYNTYNTQYHARPKTKPGPISKEEHKFDYEEWKAWHYGDNAYVQSNIKQKYVAQNVWVCVRVCAFWKRAADSDDGGDRSTSAARKGGCT